MVNISILQSEDDTASSPITLPDSFVALKITSTASKLFFQALEWFLEDENRKGLEELRGLAAAEVANFLDELVMMKLNDEPKFRNRMIHVLRSLCGSWGILPASYTLEGEVTITDKNPWTRGGFGEVWCGTWGSEKVAVKVIMITSSASPKKLKKQLSNEAIIWKKLKHRNLLPLYGVSTAIKIACIEYPHPCLVSPWMENGNIRVFVRNNPTFNRFNLLVDVCQGLIYLHSEGFVHGDLKGDNVLVDNENRACLADFGFAGACTPFRVAGASSSSDVGGTAGYMAPELFLHRSNENLSTPKGPVDVYALGMLIYEVLAGQQPFHAVHHEVIKSFVIKGDRPRRPPWISIPNHPIWDIVELCWKHEPAKRPQLIDVLHTLTSTTMSPPAEWPSPPTTVSSPSLPGSSPRDLPTPPAPATAFSGLPPAGQIIFVTEPSLQPHHPPNHAPPSFPTPTIPRHQLGGLRVTAMNFQVNFQINLVFRWRVAGGGITRQRPGATNGRNP